MNEQHLISGEKNKEALICIKCHKSVERHRADYELFEKMHWLCFHFEFEHEGDPDSPCSDPSCPQWRLQVYRDKLRSLGVDPDALVPAAGDARDDDKR
ncbi:MAG: hypothetical protein Q4P13_12750 [Psychrobacter sp.]|nr:hypothetical protein [Psychrobacter sp.]